MDHPAQRLRALLYTYHYHLIHCMGTRRKSRELLLQMLFQADMGKQSLEDVRKSFWAERSSVDNESRSFADDLFRVAIDRSREIDKLIENHAEHWRMDAWQRWIGIFYEVAWRSLSAIRLRPSRSSSTRRSRSPGSFLRPSQSNSLTECWTASPKTWKAPNRPLSRDSLSQFADADEGLRPITVKV